MTECCKKCKCTATKPSDIMCHDKECECHSIEGEKIARESDTPAKIYEQARSGKKFDGGASMEELVKIAQDCKVCKKYGENPPTHIHPQANTQERESNIDCCDWRTSNECPRHKDSPPPAPREEKMKQKHPPLPYKHNLDKICKIDGCDKLGYAVFCHICGQKKRKTLCEGHMGEHKEMNRLLRGKLTANIYYKKIPPIKN